MNRREFISLASGSALPLTRALGSFSNFVVNGAVSERVEVPRIADQPINRITELLPWNWRPSGSRSPAGAVRLISRQTRPRALGTWLICQLTGV
jgi:hypothetical protein